MLCMLGPPKRKLSSPPESRGELNQTPVCVSITECTSKRYRSAKRPSFLRLKKSLALTKSKYQTGSAISSADMIRPMNTASRKQMAAVRYPHDEPSLNPISRLNSMAETDRNEMMAPTGPWTAAPMAM